MTGVEQVSPPTAVERGSVGRKPSGKAAITERWKELRNGEQVAGLTFLHNGFVDCGLAFG